MVFMYERESDEKGAKYIKFLATSREEASRKVEEDWKDYLGPGRLLSPEEMTEKESEQRPRG
jgi:hypothetical protein